MNDLPALGQPGQPWHLPVASLGHPQRVDFIAKVTRDDVGKARNELHSTHSEFSYVYKIYIHTTHLANIDKYIIEI